jgi:hypothetical protein
MACGFLFAAAWDFTIQGGGVANDSLASRYYLCNTCSNVASHMGAAWAIAPNGYAYLVVVAAG